MPLPAPPIPFSNTHTTSALSSILLPFSGGISPYAGAVEFDPTAPAMKIMFGSQSPYAEIEELFDQRSGIPFQGNGTRTYNRRFRVRLKSLTEFPRANLLGPVAIASCPGIPIPYAPYIPYRPEEWDYKALAIMIQCDQELSDDSQTWIVTVSYSTEMPPGGPTFGNTRMPWFSNGTQSNPWFLPVVKEYDTESYAEYATVDLDSKPFVNAADTPIPGPPIMRGDRVLTITRNERLYESRSTSYEFTTNTNNFSPAGPGGGATYPPGYAYCQGSRAQEVWLGPTKFWRVTYKILLRRRIRLADGTYNSKFSPIKILNAGMYEKASYFTRFGSFPISVPISKMGHQVSNPVLLDATGKEQTSRFPAGPAANAGQLIPTYLYFRILEETNLNDLLNTGA